MTVLAQDKKVFGQAEFAAAWALWVGKLHDPASKLMSFTITNKDGSTGVAIGLLSYADLESVHFPTKQTHTTYESALASIGFALDEEL
ncbi:MAG TPA: hypothetical protein VFD09_10310 [Thiopseudomonas sp.]|nr:hypothetical protein [Thiopseudomonas sp.]